jgi:uncharacterized delta-60 repeat protein
MKPKTLSFLFIIFAGLIFASSVQSDPGDLDTTFGPDQDGRVTTGISIRDDMVRDVVVQSDGKIVVIGVTNASGGGSAFALARYVEKDGSLDKTFGGNGIVMTRFSDRIDEGYAIALHADGKIIAAGVSDVANPTPKIALARYHPLDGSLDTSFGTDGKVITSVTPSGDMAYDVAVQPDGSIVVAGATNTTSLDTRFIVARYTNDGSLDNTFGPGGSGYVITDFSAGKDTAYALAIQPGDSRIVVAGVAAEGGLSADFALVRYDTDGSLDTSFGTNGQVTTNLSGGNDGAFALVMQTDNKIIAGGIANWGVPTDQGGDFGLVRYQTDGTLDTDFDEDGIVITSFSIHDDMARALAVQADGKILAGGFAGYGYISAEFALSCYLEDGSLDDTFGSGGMVTTVFTQQDDGAFSLALQQNGKIVLAGASTFSGLSSDFALARYYSTLPVITATTPAKDATRVSIKTDVTATFDSYELMDASTFTTDSFMLQQGAVTILGVVSFHGATATAIFRPSEPLDYDTVYTATITTDVADLDENHLPTGYTWTFTTQEESSSSGGGCSCFLSTF